MLCVFLYADWSTKAGIKPIESLVARRASFLLCVKAARAVCGGPVTFASSTKIRTNKRASWGAWLALTGISCCFFQVLSLRTIDKYAVQSTNLLYYLTIGSKSKSTRRNHVIRKGPDIPTHVCASNQTKVNQHTLTHTSSKRSFFLVQCLSGFDVRCYLSLVESGTKTLVKTISLFLSLLRPCLTAVVCFCWQGKARREGF